MLFKQKFRQLLCSLMIFCCSGLGLSIKISALLISWSHLSNSAVTHLHRRKIASCFYFFKYYSFSGFIHTAVVCTLLISTSLPSFVNFTISSDFSISRVISHHEQCLDSRRDLSHCSQGRRCLLSLCVKDFMTRLNYPTSFVVIKEISLLSSLVFPD